MLPKRGLREHPIIALALFVFVILLIVLGHNYPISRNKIATSTSENLNSEQLPATNSSPTQDLEVTNTNSEPELVKRVYRDGIHGYAFEYPSYLTLSSDFDGNPTLSHSIPYTNIDCDMIDLVPTQNLVDFQTTFEVKKGNADLSFVDGEYSAGSLKGKYVLHGAEGCGEIIYYFPFEGDTLVVHRKNVQTLGGIRNNPTEISLILKIPGAISRDKNWEIFTDVLSSVHSFATSTAANSDLSKWKTYRNQTYEIEFKYPPGADLINDGLSKDGEQYGISLNAEGMEKVYYPWNFFTIWVLKVNEKNMDEYLLNTFKKPYPTDDYEVYNFIKSRIVHKNIGGKDFIRILDPMTLEADGCNGHYSYLENGLLYNIADDESCDKIYYPKMLSSFKFTK